MVMTSTPVTSVKGQKYDGRGFPSMNSSGSCTLMSRKESINIASLSKLRF